MKKKTVMLLTMLLLFCAAAESAQAATTLTLPNAVLEQSYRYDFSPVPGGRNVIAVGALPGGIDLYDSYDESSGAGNIYLQGTPTALGSSSFGVLVTDEGGATVAEYSCTLTVAAPAAPEQPVITTQPQNTTTRQGESCTLSVSVQQPAEGTLSYLWYSSAQPDMESMTAMDRGSQTAATVRVPTDAEGVSYYCVMVTNTLNGQTGSVYSGVAAVTVTAAETVSSIEIMIPPSRTVYSVGESLSTEGMSLRAWTNYGYRELTADYECYPTVFYTPGTQTVTVTFGVFYDTFTVEVRYPEPERPTILRQPENMNVKAGEDCILTVQGSVSGGGTISYLWYSSTKPDMNTMTAVDRGRETQSSLRVSTDEPGIRYYCALVMNTEYDDTVSVYSRVVTVNVGNAATPTPDARPTPTPVAPGVTTSTPAPQQTEKPADSDGGNGGTGGLLLLLGLLLCGLGGAAFFRFRSRGKGGD